MRKHKLPTRFAQIHNFLKKMLILIIMKSGLPSMKKKTNLLELNTRAIVMA